MLQFLAVPAILGMIKELSAFVLLKYAIRILILTGLTLILPVVIYNALGMLISETLDWVVNYTDGLGMSGSIIELTDLAGYLATKLKIVESLSLVLAAINVRFILSFVKR